VIRIKGLANLGYQAAFIDGQEKWCQVWIIILRLIFEKSWLRIISALTIALLVALEDDRSVSEPLLSSFFRETLENFVTIQSWRIQNGDSGKSLVGENRYLLSSFPPSEFDERKIPFDYEKDGAAL